MRSRVLLVSIALALVASSAGALAGDPLKLPKDLTLPQGADSPGPVVFSHASHVDASHPTCTTCHPRPFKMFARVTAAKTAAITHATMEKGQTCGACHNGKDAHGFDDCASCHRP